MSEPLSWSYASFPSKPGTYALVLELNPATEIVVGKLGRATFPAGFYIYVGSALGSGGLASRLDRHAKSTTSVGWRAWWHIDYLRHYTKTIEVWSVQHVLRREHVWAALIEKMPEVSVTMPGFGSTDCGCPTHLFHFSHRPSWNEFRGLLSRHFPKDELFIFKEPPRPS